MQYHYLVAGLDPYAFEAAGDGKRVETPELRDYIRGELSAPDRRTVQLLYTYYDIENIVGYIRHTNLPFNLLGNLTPAQVVHLVEDGAPENEEVKLPADFPAEITALVDRYKGRNPAEADDFEPLPDEALEAALYGAFYLRCSRTKCPFLKAWSQIDRTIRNITAASKARAMKLDASGMIVEPEGEIREQLLESQSADFGFKDRFEWTEPLLAVLDTKDFVERERGMDRLRWQIADTLTEHEYFSVDWILKYLVQLNILYRWAALDKEQGRRSFGQMVASLTTPSQLRQSDADAIGHLEK